MFEASLEEELGDEYLKIETGLLVGVLLIEIVLLDQGLDLDKAGGDGLDLGSLDRLARGCVPALVDSPNGVESRVLGCLAQVPFQTGSLLLQRLARGLHVEGVLL